MLAHLHTIFYITGLLILMGTASRCTEEDVTPGPETIVQGKLSNPQTGEPLSNAKLVVVKSWSMGLSGGRNYRNIDSTYSNADGSYYLKFIPEGQGIYMLYSDISQQVFTYVLTNDVNVGKTNIINWGIKKAVGVTVNLKNNSSQNSSQFKFWVDSCCQSPAGYYTSRTYGRSDIVQMVKDTVLRYKVPDHSVIVLTSIYHNGYYTSGPNTGTLNEQLRLSKTITVNRADTVVSIVNP